MPANIDPIYSRRGEVGNSTSGVSTAFPAVFTAANTALDGTGTVVTVFTADATNGGFLKSIIIKQANAAAAVSTACVARFFINNGATNVTATNNVFYKAMVLPANTPSTTADSPEYEIPCGIVLRETWKILGIISVAQTTTGFHMYGVGGSY